MIMYRQVMCLLCLVFCLCLRRAETITRPSINTFLPQDNDNVLENLYLKTPEIITKYGYPVETHTVTTEDGYLLTVHRIPGSPRAASSGVKTPVLLTHALLMASDVWVATGPEKGLAFLLADQGYDVWMGNARGNLYSRRHRSLSVNDHKFWDFTVHEMAVYDLPATIDHILAVTNHQQVFYISHSMGGPSYFILGATRPEYNRKVRLMVAMAPGVYNGGKSSLLGVALRVVGSVNQTEVFPRSNAINSLLSVTCQDGNILQTICSLSYFQIYGNNPKELNTTLLPLYLGISLSGTSSASMAHFGQIFQKGRFQLYDREATTRGSVADMPEYNLSLVSTPVAIMYGQNDAILDPKGLVQLSRKLPNVVRMLKVDRATHGDFVFGTNANTLIYNDVITMMERYR